jgi:hypothetical protein
MIKRKILISNLVFTLILGLFFYFSFPADASEFKGDIYLQSTLNPWHLSEVHDLRVYHNLNVWGHILSKGFGGEPVVIADNLDVQGWIARKWGPVQIFDGIEQLSGQSVTFSGRVEAKNGLDVTGDITVTGKVDGVDLSASNYLPLVGGTLTGDLSLASLKKVDGIDVSTIPFTYLALTGGVLTGPVIMDGVSGLTDTDIPNNITISGYLPLTGGTVSGDLTVSNKLTVGGTIVDPTFITISPTNNANALIVKESTGAFNAVTINENGEIVSYNPSPAGEKTTISPGQFKVEDSNSNLIINSDAEITSDTADILIQGTNQDMAFIAGGPTHAGEIRIRADAPTGYGTVEIWAANFIPYASGTVSLGKTGNEWKDLYLTGNLQGGTATLSTSVSSPIYTGTAGVTLSSGGSSNLVLDSASGTLILGSGTDTITNLDSENIVLKLANSKHFVINNRDTATDVATIKSNGDLWTAGELWVGPVGSTYLDVTSSEVEVASGVTLKVNGSVEGIDSYSNFVFGISGLVTAGATNYMNPGSGTPNASEISIPIPKTGTIAEMWVYAATAPGVGVTDTMTVRKNGVNTSMTVSLAGAGQTGYDNVHSFSLSAGDRISISYTAGVGSVASDIMVTLVYKTPVE